MSKDMLSPKANPFEPIKPKKNKPPSIKYCAWEVLKDKPNGLVLSDLVKEIEDRELRKFSGKRSSSKVLLGELRKQKEYFIQDEKNSWRIKTSEIIDSEETEDDESLIKLLQQSQHKKANISIEEKKKISPSKPIKQDDNDEKLEDLRVHSIKEKSKMGSSPSPLPSHSHSPSPSHKRKLERTPSPRLRKKAKGSALVGAPVKVWWASEQQYFPGLISSYNAEKNRYDVSYEDGDIDNDLEFKRYELEMKGSEIKWVTINEHNMDDSDDTSGKEDTHEANKDGDKEGDGDGDEKAEEEITAVKGEGDEKEPSDEGEEDIQK